MTTATKARSNHKAPAPVKHREICDAVPRFNNLRQIGRLEDCWPFLGATVRGYGYFKVGGRKRLQMRAHRYAYLIAYGKLTPGMTIDHVCRNKACVNPLHLEEVTYAENNIRSPFTISTVNRNKTHCKSGHEFTHENTYVYYASNSPKRAKGIHRACRACKRESIARTTETATKVA